MPFEHLADQAFGKPRKERPVMRDLDPGLEERKVDRRYRGAYEDPDMPPRLTYDAQDNLLLHIEPRSIQAELMVKANTIVLQSKVDALSNPNIPGDEARQLQAEVKTLEALTARLRGYTPYNPNRQLPKPRLRERVGNALLTLAGSGVEPPARKPAETYIAPKGVSTGNTFTNTDATLLLHNLNIAAADLRQHVKHQIIPDPTTASNLAEDMVTLRTDTFERMFEAQAQVQMPQVHPPTA